MDRVRTFVSNKILTLSLASLFLLIYLIELFTTASWRVEQFGYWFLFTPSLDLIPGWILLLFAHETVSQLAVNLVGILAYGFVLERYLTRKSYLLVYVTSGLLAGFIHTNLTENAGTGANGAIMGILGFYSAVYLLMYRPDGWNRPLENVRYILAILGLFVIAVQFAANFYINGGSDGIAHIAGALIGGILGIGYVMSQLEGTVFRTIESAKESPLRTALLMLVLAETTLIIHFLSTIPDDSATSTAVQAGATIILVLITIWYADHTRRNADLFRRKLELETQRNHADTLQIRTDKWLNNLPKVQETDIPAFDEVDTDDSFAIPQVLQGDPYFEDLLKNHATDLDGYTDTIEANYTEFREIREDFIQNIEIDPLLSETQSIEVLEENYAMWWFERVLLLERTEKSEDDLQLALESAIMNANYEENDNIYFVGDEVQNRKKPILVYYPQGSINSQQNSYWNKIRAGILKARIQDIESHPNHDRAVKAAELLNKLESEIEQLEKKLIEYNEAPRFEGDCDLILDLG